LAPEEARYVASRPGIETVDISEEHSMDLDRIRSDLQNACLIIRIGWTAVEIWLPPAGFWPSPKNDPFPRQLLCPSEFGYDVGTFRDPCGKSYTMICRLCVHRESAHPRFWTTSGWPGVQTGDILRPYMMDIDSIRSGLQDACLSIHVHCSVRQLHPVLSALRRDCPTASQRFRTAEFGYGTCDIYEARDKPSKLMCHGLSQLECISSQLTALFGLLWAGLERRRPTWYETERWISTVSAAVYTMHVSVFMSTLSFARYGASFPLLFVPFGPAWGQAGRPGTKSRDGYRQYP
jgi:hypothetical protein